MLIGLTGGIATGKSTAAEILNEQGADVIGADDISHEIMQKGKEGWNRVVNFFGKDILDSEGNIDRKRLGEIVFANPKKRKRLEQLTHPLIIEELCKKIRNCSGDIIVVEVPLLYEIGFDDFVDQVWVIYAERQVQIERLCKRDELSQEEAEMRIDSQLPLSKKCKIADEVIENNGSVEKLEKNIIKLWKVIENEN